MDRDTFMDDYFDCMANAMNPFFEKIGINAYEDYLSTLTTEEEMVQRRRAVDLCELLTSKGAGLEAVIWINYTFFNREDGILGISEEVYDFL